MTGTPVHPDSEADAATDGGRPDAAGAPGGEARPEPVEAPAAQAGVAEFARTLEGQLTGMEARILEAFEQKLAFDATKEKQIDRLHEENTRYRADLVGRAVRPVFQSLIRLHDDLGKVLEALAREDAAQVTADRLLKLLGGFRDDVELALNHNGVTAFRTESETFDPRRQRVLRSVETAEPSQVGQLASRLRPGFEINETILEKERVAVYALPQPKPAP